MLVGAPQLNEAKALEVPLAPLSTSTFVGTPGAPMLALGLAGALGRLAGPVPTELTAATVNP